MSFITIVMAGTHEGSSGVEKLAVAVDALPAESVAVAVIAKVDWARMPSRSIEWRVAGGLSGGVSSGFSAAPGLARGAAPTARERSVVRR